MSIYRSTKKQVLERLTKLEDETQDPMVSAIRRCIEDGRSILDALLEGFSMSVRQRVYLQDAMNELLLKTPPTFIFTSDQNEESKRGSFVKGQVEETEFQILKRRGGNEGKFNVDFEKLSLPKEDEETDK